MNIKSKNGRTLIKWLPRQARIIFFGERSGEFFAVTQVGYRSNTQRIFKGKSGKMEEIIIKGFIEDIGGSYDTTECKDNIEFDFPKHNSKEIIMRNLNNGGRIIIQKANYQLMK